MKAADSFYKSARWQRLRAMVLRRDGYQCQVSKRYGKRVEATTVHHVFPREEFPEYQWEPWNLISLAGDVHDEMHDRQSGALTEKGVELLKRVARREGVKVPLRYRR
ncbi:MAG: HNH endonuclease [Oscillospiraceae bacterium]|nr:HNH endonuclease [Oscillospiraceae bacterium]